MNNNGTKGSPDTEVSGLLAINKAREWSSFDVVNKLRRLYNTRRVGHTGTLDPMAEGVLVALVGRAAKASEYAVDGDKEYLARIKLGVVSDTEDIFGECKSTGAPLPTEDEFFAAAEKFVGDIMQTPPMYSALKVDGHKLVNLARRGVTIERQARPIKVYSINAKKLCDDEYEMLVRCGRGTYIRTLCADIGSALGCGAVMSSLLRTETCGISLASAHTIEEIEAMNEEERRALLLPTESLFASLTAYTPDEFNLRLCRNGCELYQDKIGTSFALGERVRLCDETGFFALGEVSEFESGSAIKAIKFFRL